MARYSVNVRFLLPLSKSVIIIPISGKYKKTLTEAINNMLLVLAQSFFSCTIHTSYNYMIRFLPLWQRPVIS